MSLATGIDKIRERLAAKASKFMPDLCDIEGPATITQGAGHTTRDGVIATDIPCRQVQGGGGAVSFHDGGSVLTKPEKLELPYTATTAAISREHKIRMHARGVNPEKVFEQPVAQTDSMSPLLTVLAIHTAGYRQPGIA